ncbi:MAG: hypothetical protein IT186_12310 [Acidobacteria bacterium]|nr:hypothetical protein [Acidobacteriota bacterium]MCG3195365.1 hypothetical protein [Thermoanaerobaculia bacterium]
MKAEERVLAAEVWLGPLEGLRAVTDPSGAGRQTIRIGRLAHDRRTGEPNQLVLAGTPAGSSHAVVRLAGPRIILNDLRSPCGTFAREQQIDLDADTELSPGEVFLVSRTAIVVFLTAPLPAPPPFEPVPAGDWGDPAVRDVLRVGLEAAARRDERYIDTRHLLDALLRMHEPWLDEVFPPGGASRHASLEALWTRSVFSRETAWLADVLMCPEFLSTRVGQDVVSPKVGRLLDAASEGLPPAASERAHSGDREHPFRERERSYR